jgi:hypothetical protein
MRRRKKESLPFRKGQKVSLPRIPETEEIPKEHLRIDICHNPSRYLGFKKNGTGYGKKHAPLFFEEKLPQSTVLIFGEKCSYFRLRPGFSMAAIYDVGVLSPEEEKISVYGVALEGSALLITSQEGENSMKTLLKPILHAHSQSLVGEKTLDFRRLAQILEVITPLLEKIPQNLGSIDRIPHPLICRRLLQFSPRVQAEGDEKESDEKGD